MIFHAMSGLRTGCSLGRWLGGLVWMVGVVSSAQADGLSSLENFLRHTHSASTEFTQTVISPQKEKEATRTKVSQGTFEFQRPQRFRFVYRKPFEQIIVADGQSIWLHDVDMNQVTVRDQAQALAQTPAALLAGVSDLKALQKDFDVSSLNAVEDAQGQEWVQAIPKKPDGQIQSVRMGFQNQQLITLEIRDTFGQISTLKFTQFRSNPKLAESTFRFQPPAGVDVVRQ